MILETIGKPEVAVKRVERLGKAPDANSEYKRPIKLILDDPRARKGVLKEAEECHWNFHKYLSKKDVHPMVRKELNRLREVTKKEKDKVKNQGKAVRYDHTTRRVLVNEEVVDQFQTAFF